MPVIDLCFSGYVRGADIRAVTVTATGMAMELPTRTTAAELADKLSSGEWCISLGDFLYDNNKDSEIEMFDFESAQE